MRLLLISNSTNFGEVYLGWPREYIKDFLKNTDVRKILFIPYAGVGLSIEGLDKSFDIYEEKVKSVFNELGYTIYSIHSSWRWKYIPPRIYAPQTQIDRGYKETGN